MSRLTDDDRVVLTEVGNFCTDTDCACGGNPEPLFDAVERLLTEHITEALRIEREAACLYGNPDWWCRGTGMHRPYWRQKARALARELRYGQNQSFRPEGSDDQ